MTCEKCCFWPCTQTNAKYVEGAYWKIDRYGNLIKMIEPSPAVRVVLERAVLEALESEI